MRKALLILVAPLGLAACGSTTTTTETKATPPPQPSVALSITRPRAATMTVTAPRLRVAGTTEPGATVTAGNATATVDPSGKWHATVSLDFGEQSVDVNASKPGRDDGSESLDVTRRHTAAQLAAIR